MKWNNIENVKAIEEIEKWLKHIENSYDSKWEQTCLKNDQIMLKDLEEKTGIFYKFKQEK